mmetsp:Transcript_12714/g.21562  ORF Transcript_12714/g.21562 Transcript_12714/m.21562 type:complete len:259 (-) Transcript_12714:148-924(-)
MPRNRPVSGNISRVASCTFPQMLKYSRMFSSWYENGSPPTYTRFGSTSPSPASLASFPPAASCTPFLGFWVLLVDAEAASSARAVDAASAAASELGSVGSNLATGTNAAVPSSCAPSFKSSTADSAGFSLSVSLSSFSFLGFFSFFGWLDSFGVKCSHQALCLFTGRLQISQFSTVSVASSPLSAFESSSFFERRFSFSISLARLYKSKPVSFISFASGGATSLFATSSVFFFFFSVFFFFLTGSSFGASFTSTAFFC